MAGSIRLLKRVERWSRIVLYYFFARYLPTSHNRYFKWGGFLRRWLCAPLFRVAGNNINIETGACFGKGSKVSIGSNSGIGINCVLSGEVKIGDNVMMGPDVIFITTTHGHSRVDIPMIEQGYIAERPITVGDDVWIGTRCIILPGVAIGKGVIVGAGSVVTKSVPDYVVVAGNPARIVKRRILNANEHETINK